MFAIWLPHRLTSVPESAGIIFIASQFACTPLHGADIQLSDCKLSPVEFQLRSCMRLNVEASYERYSERAITYHSLGAAPPLTVFSGETLRGQALRLQP